MTLRTFDRMWVALMKLVIAGFILAALAAIVGSQPLQAADGLQRCESSDGVVYTDKPCALFGAKAVPMSGEMLGRIAREEAQSLDAAIEQGIAIKVDLPTARPIGRRSLASGCARTPTQLAMDLQGAFALGNVNRVAESYHWTGLDHARGQRIMDRLEHLVRRPIVDSHFYTARIYDASDTSAWLATSTADSGNDGVLQVVFGEGGSVTDFEVVRYAGCYFVKF